MQTTEKLSALRKLMAEAGAKALYVISNDTHQTESVSDHWKAMQWLTGFSGEAATVLIAGWMSIGGGVSVAAALIDQGSIGVHDIAILCPALILMGSQLQYMGRCSGVIGTRGSRIPLLMSISVLNAMIAMLIMSIIV